MIRPPPSSPPSPSPPLSASAGPPTGEFFPPRPRAGPRRFIPIPVDAELAEVHILDNEEESRAYIDRLWAEAMTIYNSGDYKLAFSPAMQETLQIGRAHV